LLSAAVRAAVATLSSAEDLERIRLEIEAFDYAGAGIGDGTGLRFETGEHGDEYPDNTPRRSR
jgi:hypothetical protein